MATVIDAWSLCVTPIFLRCNGHQIGHATGAWWRAADGRTFLISNWHVFSGREPLTGQAKNSEGAVPDEIEIQIVSEDDPNLRAKVMLRLTNGQGAVNWRQHSVFGQRADVALMELTWDLQAVSARAGKRVAPFAVNGDVVTSVLGQPVGQNKRHLQVSSGMDVFVLGYPLGISGDHSFPIWKRGSIATEYRMDYDNMPCFLIDTATREGMSGGAVLTRYFGMAVFDDGTSGMGTSNFTEFIGVYSGRNILRMHEAQLGIVWKRSVVEEIIAQGVPGTYELA